MQKLLRGRMSEQLDIRRLGATSAIDAGRPHGGPHRPRPPLDELGRVAVGPQLLDQGELEGEVEAVE